MKVNGLSYRTIWRAQDRRSVEVIDQTALPHAFRTRALANLDQARAAIADMIVRGAPLIGATGAYGMALAAQADPGDDAVEHAAAVLGQARPTAVNLRWAVERAKTAILAAPPAQRAEAAWAEAEEIAEQDVAACAAIGRQGLALIEKAAAAATVSTRI